VEIMVVPPAETLPETLADASEEIEITADTAKTEPPPESDVAAVVEIAKTVMEQAKI